MNPRGAVLKIRVPDGKRILYRLWIGSDDPPEGRRQILLDAKDNARVPSRDRTQRRVRVKDHITGKHVVIRSASCGLDCFCALEIVAPKRRKK